jgi:hypothetical protein
VFGKSYARLRVTSIIVFSIGLLSVSVALAVRQANGKKLRPRKGFTLVTKDVGVPFAGLPEDPAAIRSAMSVRYQKSDGTWKTVRKYFNSRNEVVKKDVSFGIPGEGVFKADFTNHTFQFLSSMPSKEKASYVAIDNGHSHPNFLKEELVHGFQTYVLRFPATDGGYTDLYCAPELDGFPIRQVSVSSVGTAVTELVEIRLGDPDERAFAGLPKWLVKYDVFRQKIETLEREGKQGSAQSMRKELEERIAHEEREP